MVAPHNIPQDIYCDTKNIAASHMKRAQLATCCLAVIKEYGGKGRRSGGRGGGREGREGGRE